MVDSRIESCVCLIFGLISERRRLRESEYRVERIGFRGEKQKSWFFTGFWGGIWGLGRRGCDMCVMGLGDGDADGGEGDGVIFFF